MLTSGLFDSTTIPALEQVVNCAQRRHEVLAGNIANIDTPGYRVRDLSPDRFEDRLKTAIRERNEDQASISRHGYFPVDTFKKVGENMQGMLYHDDSNVTIEQQIIAMNKNWGKHNMALTIMRSQFRLLETAISERV